MKLSNHLHSIALLVSAFCGYSGAQAAPLDSATLIVPESGEIVFEDSENYSANPSRLRLYFIPTESVLETNDLGQKQWSYKPLPNRRAMTSFTLRLEPSASLKKHAELLKEKVSSLHGMSKENVELAILPVFDTSIHVFEDDDVFEVRSVPPHKVPLGAPLSFLFKTNARGTQWFKEEVVQGKLPLGVIEGSSKFQLGDGNFETRKFSFQLRLNEVPYCAVTAVGCEF